MLVLFCWSCYVIMINIVLVVMIIIIDIIICYYRYYFHCHHQFIIIFIQISLYHWNDYFVDVWLKKILSPCRNGKLTWFWKPNNYQSDMSWLIFTSIDKQIKPSNGSFQILCTTDPHLLFQNTNPRCHVMSEDDRRREGNWISWNNRDLVRNRATHFGVGWFGDPKWRNTLCASTSCGRSDRPWKPMDHHSPWHCRKK